MRDAHCSLRPAGACLHLAVRIHIRFVVVKVAAGVVVTVAVGLWRRVAEWDGGVVVNVREAGCCTSAAAFSRIELSQFEASVMEFEQIWGTGEGYVVW